jgi:protein tyrosine/serine phosphatase
MRVSGRFLRGCAAASVLLVSIYAPSLAQTNQNDKLSRISIENFGCVNENYYRGAQPKERDYKELAAIGIKTIVDLEREGEAGEQKLVELAGMRFYRIGMSARSKPDLAQIDQFLKIVNDPVNQPVFVHCHGGRHRTGIMTAIYRMRNEGWTAERSYNEMKQYQFEKGFGHGSLKDYVYAYKVQLEHAGQATATASGSRQ